MAQDISVVVPVYNTSRFLGKCFDSILSQTYKNFKLIIVDDCSTDDSLSFCKQIAEKDSRVEIIEKKVNEGVDKARYDGLMAAETKFVTFVDSDDWLASTAFQDMHEVMLLYDVDMVCAEQRRAIFEKMPNLLPTSNIGQFPQYKDRKIDGHQYKYIYRSFFGINMMSVSMCAKLYKTELLRSLPQVPYRLKFGEDLLLNMRLYPLLKSIYWLDKIEYYYRIVSGGTSGFMPYFMDNARTLYDLKMQELAKNTFDEDYRCYVKIELINCLLTHIRQYQHFFPKNKACNVKAISEELQQPVYDDLRGLEYSHTDVLAYILDKDATALYDLVEKEQKCKPLKLKLRDCCFVFSKKILKFCGE